MGWGNTTYKLYWGDSHTNIHENQLSFLDETMKAAKDTLDFFPIAYYPFFYYTYRGLYIESVGYRRKFDSQWKKIQEAVVEYNAPGEFVTFLGYEWHGDRQKYGDHNVFYFDDFQPLDHSSTLSQLYENLRKNKGIAIPHHTAYQVGQRGKDWSFYNEELSPLVEIYSAHGSSEGCNTPYSLNRNFLMSPRVSQGSVQEGLAKGYRLGIIASGDNHYGYPGVWGCGLMGVYALELTRESLWDAFMHRHTYGVTGDRIRLEFFADDRFMGDEFPCNGPIHLKASVIGSQALDRIEIIRNNKLIYTSLPNHSSEVILGQDKVMRFKLKIEFGWGPDPNQEFCPHEKTWIGFLQVQNGRIISLEPCFTYFNQKVKCHSQEKYSWELVTVSPNNPRIRNVNLPRAGIWGSPSSQALIFEIETRPDSLLILNVDSQLTKFTVREALAHSRIVAFQEKAKRMIREYFSLSPEEIENPDVFYHHAYKIKVHKAVPVEGYERELDYVDRNPPRGKNFYYLRVSQLDGQMAWSSPIWVWKE